MADSKMTTDQSGNMLTYLGLKSTCGDMARFGTLALDHGNWRGRQIVSSEWMRASTKPSQDLEVSYGYLWWLNTAHSNASSAEVATGGDHATDRVAQDRLVPGAPTDIVMALGLGNQMVIIIPSKGIVAVRLGSSKSSSFDQAVFANGVLDALEE
jgi:CubicO group peptidase (beta-lactamase class C family)